MKMEKCNLVKVGGENSIICNYKYIINIIIIISL